MIAYQKVIMERFMSPRQLEEFTETYWSHRIKQQRGTRMATDTDLMILKDYQRGMSFRELKDKYHFSQDKIGNCLRIAAISKL